MLTRFSSTFTKPIGALASVPPPVPKHLHWVVSNLVTYHTSEPSEDSSVIFVKALIIDVGKIPKALWSVLYRIRWMQRCCRRTWEAKYTNVYEQESLPIATGWWYLLNCTCDCCEEPGQMLKNVCYGHVAADVVRWSWCLYCSCTFADSTSLAHVSLLLK